MLIQERTIESPASVLRERLESGDATACVVGMGYVGLPLASAVVDAGFRVLGYDIDCAKVDALTRGRSYLKHLGPQFFERLANAASFTPTNDPTDIARADVILLCVPTPLGAHREPDLSFVHRSANMVTKVLRPGHLVVLESTTYPGTTRDEVVPLLEASGLTCGTDFFVAYSPEREDPGRENTRINQVPKLIGGVDSLSGELAKTFYSRVIQSVHLVESAEIAEAAKLLENIYRSVNIALVNELKVLLGRMNIDIWEVVNAASTKPFGFQAFFPGPGLGGHCIPIDPYYLTWKAKEYGLNTKFIELAGDVNSNMPSYVVQQISTALNKHGKPLNGSSILVVGVAYKKNVDDMRETPAAEILDQLENEGARVAYHDPYVPIFPAMRRHSIDMVSTALDVDAVTSTDCIVIVTDHDDIDYELIAGCATLIVDTRNAMSRVQAIDGTLVKA